MLLEDRAVFKNQLNQTTLLYFDQILRTEGNCKGKEFSKSVFICFQLLKTTFHELKTLHIIRYNSELEMYAFNFGHTQHVCICSHVDEPGHEGQ